MTPTATGWTETVIYQFINYINGGDASGMIIAPDGSLYGIAGEGTTSYGYVFNSFLRQVDGPPTSSTGSRPRTLAGL